MAPPLADNEAQQVLLDQVDRAIEDIQSAPSSPNCPAHAPMARGLVVLLQCQKAQLSQPPAPSVAKWAAGMGTAAGAGIVAIVETVRALLPHQ